MKTIDELGISPTPWMTWQSNRKRVKDCRAFAIADCDYENLEDVANARLISAAPELYEALFDCCEEVNGHDAPRCYGCRRGEDGHCMARGVCNVYKALAKAAKEGEEK